MWAKAQGIEINSTNANGKECAKSYLHFCGTFECMCQCHSQHLMRADLLINRSCTVVCESNIFVCNSLIDMNAKYERAWKGGARQGAQDFAVFWMSMILWYLKCEERQNALKLLKQNAIWRDDVTPHHFCGVPKGMCLCSCISRGKVACSWARSYKVVASLLTLSKRCRDSYCTFCLSFIISLQSGQLALFAKAHTPFSTNSATMKPYGVVHGWASWLQWPSAGSRGLSTWSPVIQLFLWAQSCFMLTGFMLTSSSQYTL